MRYTHTIARMLVIFLLGGGVGVFLFPQYALGNAIDDLKAKIADRNATIKALDADIANYQKQLTATSKQKQSLQQILSVLADTRKQLLAKINKTENQIDATNLEISELQLEITDKERQIGGNVTSLQEIIRSMRQNDSDTTLETILSQRHLSDAIDSVERLIELQQNVSGHVHDLEALQKGLEDQKKEAEGKKADLVSFQNTLSDQKQLVEYNTTATNKLLASTKNQESTYQKTIASKQKLKEQSQQELYDIESQLKLTIDQSALPAAGSGVLRWPLDSVLITQKFGMTAFAASGAYNGQGHNGIDFAASIGTPVKAARGGTITDTGDTDLTCPSASYGRWVLIKHDNGLSTLYAHLSLIKVTKGDTVGLGDIIGYSGFTGYATGPHLHFTVYATQGVQVMDRQSKVCGGMYRMPVADLKAYLNPLLYL